MADYEEINPPPATAEQLLLRFVEGMENLQSGTQSRGIKHIPPAAQRAMDEAHDEMMRLLA